MLNENLNENQHSTGRSITKLELQRAQERRQRRLRRQNRAARRYVDGWSVRMI